MKGVNFPIIGTKVKGLTEEFNLSDRAQRRKYFDAKVGSEIKQIRKFLKKGTFLANIMGKKNAGKGTYSKMLGEALEVDNLVHVAVGDLVREVHGNWTDFAKSKEFGDLKKNYRGFISFDEAVDRLHGRSTTTLLPTEFILALLKHKISQLPGKSIFIDGMPRETDQISYSLFFRDLFDFRDDPDLLIFIDIPEVVIDERIKYRVICPICKTPRNLKLLATKYPGFDKGTNSFFLMCDNPTCNKARMVPKEGDNLGIEPIRHRLEKDEEIMKLLVNIHGVPKVFLRNDVPAEEALKNFDAYEITPAYSYELEKNGAIKTIESPWVFKNDNGIDSNSLLPAPVVVSLIKQLPKALGL